MRYSIWHRSCAIRNKKQCIFSAHLAPSGLSRQCHTLYVHDEVCALLSEFQSIAGFRFESCDFSEKASNYPPIFWVWFNASHENASEPIPEFLLTWEMYKSSCSGAIHRWSELRGSGTMMSSAVVLNLLLLVSIASAGHHYGGSVTFSPKGTNADGSMRVRVYFLFRIWQHCPFFIINT